MKRHCTLPSSPGYIALSSMLMIAAIIVIIGTTASLLAINAGQISLADTRQENVLNLVESCIEDSLLQLNKSNTLPSSLSLPEGNCTVTLNSQVGSVWTFTISATLNGHTKTLQVTTNRTTQLTITNWIEQ
ncbi:MAG TPA: hypothetical protein VD999_06370 [Vitreimonas sp.]|nr:hypothetical protein [Vitreimonas sp.]